MLDVMDRKTSKQRERHPATRKADRGRRLIVVAERQREPDWDRYTAALIALALRRVEERASGDGQEERG
jgi:hypothetical protein